PGSSLAAGTAGTIRASSQALTRRESGARSIQIDPLTTHGDPFPPQQLGLDLAFRNRAVRSHDPMPRQLEVRRGQDPAEQPRSFRVDVAVRLDVTDRDVANSLDNARETGSAKGRSEERRVGQG